MFTDYNVHRILSWTIVVGCLSTAMIQYSFVPTTATYIFIFHNIISICLYRSHILTNYILKFIFLKKHPIKIPKISNINYYVKIIDNKHSYFKNLCSKNLYFTAHVLATYLLKIYILKIYILKNYAVNIYSNYNLKTIIKNKNIFFKIYLNNKFLASKNFIFTISIYFYNINDVNKIDTKIYFLNYIHYNFVLEHINSLTKNKLYLFTKNLSVLCLLENFNYLCLTDKYCGNNFLVIDNYILISTTRYCTSKIKFKIQLNIVILKLFKNETFHLCTLFLHIFCISLFVLHFLYFIFCTHLSIINYIKGP